MVDPTTVNSCLSVPIRGSDVGTWDLPVNANTNAIDSMFGGVTTIILAAANVTMTSTQGQSAVIRLTGTLANSVNVVLSPIIKGWTIDNQLTNSPSSFAAFIVTPGSTYALGAPPGHHDIFYDGSAIHHRNMGRVGEYWDYASSGVPTWVTGSTKPPWLNCNGTTFSATTWPILASILGSTTLPDTRGRARMAMNQTTGRVTIFNGDTLYLGGGDQQVQSHTHTGTTDATDPSHSHTGTTNATDPAHTHTGTTALTNIDHTHGGTTFGANSSLDHLHSNANGCSNVSTTGGGGFATGFATNVATGANDRSLDHTHSFTSNGMNSNQTHSHTFTTNSTSISHTHTFTSNVTSISHTHTFTSAAFGSGASLNMPPRLVHGITMIRAA